MVGGYPGLRSDVVGRDYALPPPPPILLTRLTGYLNIEGRATLFPHSDFPTTLGLHLSAILQSERLTSTLLTQDGGTTVKLVRDDQGLSLGSYKPQQVRKIPFFHQPPRPI